MPARLSVPPAVCRAVLAHVEQQWRLVPPAARPPGMWIRLHTPLPSHVDSATTLVEAVWLLDGDGLRRYDLAAYQRLHALQVVRYSQARSGGRGTIFGRRVPEIGWAAFARYQDSGEGSSDLYLEMVWDVDRGEGQRVFVREDGRVQIRRQLWVS